MGRIIKNRITRRVSIRSFVVVPALILLAACEPVLTGGGEAAVVNRLAAQGFTLVSDGRANDHATALSYSGTPGAIIECKKSGDQFSRVARPGAIRTTDGLSGKESMRVDAYVIVDNNGQRRGVYSSTIVREIRTLSGKLLGREIETVDFKPGATGRFKNGLACRAAS